jgi:ketosteroid isomerase-like protein/ribosomal protein L37E
MASPAVDVDDQKQLRDSHSSLNRSPELERSPEVEEFFKRLIDKQDLSHADEQTIAAALRAIQGLGSSVDAQTEKSTTPSSDDYSPEGLPVCRRCGHHNQVENQFCGMCGEPLGQSAEAGSWKGPTARHQYHHHYHHHYFQAAAGAELVAGAIGQRPPASTTAKEPGRVRASLGGPALSRTEAALRQMTQDWALACNNRQLDDLLAFYATDALVLRPNFPAVRGTAAIREFFCAALDSGLGDVEMEPFRVELLGDFAYEAGRCQMLVPVAVGKRREERGKYVVVFARQTTGEWKAVVDSWSSDLSLNPAEASPAKANPLPPGGAPRIRR